MLLFSVCSWGVVVSACPPRSEWLSRAPSLPSTPAESQGLGLGPSCLCRPQPRGGALGAVTGHTHAVHTGALLAHLG